MSLTLHGLGFDALSEILRHLNARSAIKGRCPASIYVLVKARVTFPALVCKLIFRS